MDSWAGAPAAARGHPARPPRCLQYMLPHLHSGRQVDQAILSEEDRVVVIRFGHDWDPTCENGRGSEQAHHD
uniref:Uncharacterized protein n=1 Tax=Microcebus murinus TaxID=30608 RepID=A0A8C5VXB2_MICMU